MPITAQALLSGMHKATASTANQVADRIGRTLRDIHGMHVSKDLQLFSYNVRFSALDNGASATQSFNVDAGSDFIWTHGLAYIVDSTNQVPFLAYHGNAVQGALAAIYSAPIRCTILDTRTSRQLENQAVPLTHRFGLAPGLPYELSKPVLFTKQATITVQLTRFGEGQVVASTGAATNVNLDIDLTFQGYRVFDPKFLNLTQ